MQPDQGWGFSLLKVAVHGIPDLLAQLLQVVCLRMNGGAHGTGPKGAIVGFLYDKKNFVHGPALLPVEVWQWFLALGL